MTNPYSPDYRIGDEERRQAMEQLGAHYAQGRLTFVEYDERVQQVAAATMRSELLQMFDDLPQHQRTIAPTQMYSLEEIEASRKSGRNIRGGIMGLSSVAVLALISGWEQLAPLFFLIPAVYILLYVMKVGPASWHAPSPKQLERERIREITAAQREEIAALEAQAQAQKAQQRAQRKMRREEMNTAATEIASDVLKRFRQR
ncbi:DUF1707 SHOCT-like domain-containing protein [Corynebacterium pelargi]|uniref:Uncharacterized protein n=1 Tax=Corynebacterium pelargi TaxID=1471400 RepID=A0A410W6E5_9CORY|nr:DUF1707 domain-containing protein [Corynebacterium pelargi]QAU51535.1 hypothetical protein CPELA_01175 [Corynebacterium pelargi]GGG79836.1 hypothetical protein GCM10007338_17770 [Corynebacterium pelargi]